MVESCELFAGVLVAVLMFVAAISKFGGGGGGGIDDFDMVCKTLIRIFFSTYASHLLYQNFRYFLEIVH